MKKLQTIFTITSALLILQACGPQQTEKKAKLEGETISVKVIPLEKQDVNQSITASGQFSTDDETILSFKTGGILKSINVKEGDFVHKGQVLATLDLTEIAAQVNQAQLGFDKAKRDYERASKLFKDSVATLEQSQNAKTGLDVAKQQLDAARFNLNFSEIKAINDGYVLKKFANVGQLVGPGTPVLQTNGAGKSDWILKVGVSDKEWASIKIGDKAEIKADAIKDKKCLGKVIRKSETADPYNGSFTIEIKVEATIAKQLATGMFGNATIQTSNAINVWSIPYESLLDANANKAFVFVTNDNKTAKKVTVNLFRITSTTALVDEGLENQSNLIVSGSAYLKDNSSISVVK